VLPAPACSTLFLHRAARQAAAPASWRQVPALAGRSCRGLDLSGQAGGQGRGPR